ncbi:sulfite exporter TauE/SafE family protein [Flavisolibacter ginsenosidimutans]|uniref:Sulfite exporter TauE/SafE family protein n=1 Tax=Flavisolibacter ginsenosidimutans TaxID=661481 RepID=A0A5B8UFB9_9BACT|nr:sulfite exporter TauE/SafE family protein [Flavisolibacter ginsenosidimutans]QEC54800.1 sulfite exporter TauE/SafE family protein [Flavisolibacter ginsenosidimutans]
MNVLQIIGIAFAMGAVGSLHCIGMCGPIALSLPMGARSTNGRLHGALLYNLGRIVTYSWLGLVLGLAGGFLITPKAQSTVSVVFGAAILLYLLLPSDTKKRFGKTPPAQSFFLVLRKGLGKLLSTPTNQSLFGIGLLNGLLPCGMIYLALTSSFLTGSLIKGSLFMAAFGAGTFPAMLTVAFFGSFVNQKMRLNFRKAVPFFLACMAVLLVLRGLNLGIPYLSPSLPQHSGSADVLCHQ